MFSASMNLILWFELLPSLFVLSLLGYAAFYDWKYREVIDLPWIIIFLVSIPINILRIIIYWNDPLFLFTGLISIILGIVLAFFMGLVGLWGEADVLAVIVISLMLPWPVFNLPFANPILNQTIKFFPLSLTIILNSALLQLPIPLGIVIKNILMYLHHPEWYREPLYVSKFQKISAAFLGSPLTLEKIITMRPWFYSFLEKYYIPFHINWQQYSIGPKFIRLKSEPLLRVQKFGLNFQYNSWYQNSKNPMLPALPSLSQTLKYRRKMNFRAFLGTPEEDLLSQREVLEIAQHDPLLKRLWIQYSIPMLIPLFFGLLISIFVGNIHFLVFFQAI